MSRRLSAHEPPRATAQGAAGLPSSVLFMCSLNAVRSPMAAALMRRLHGARVYVESCGIRPDEHIDPFVVAVLAEMGLNVADHTPRALDEIEDPTSFDLIITLSPEAHHHAMELTRTSALSVEYWPTLDPTAVRGSREQRLAAYRLMRDDLFSRLKQRFPPQPATGV